MTIRWKPNKKKFKQPKVLEESEEKILEEKAIGVFVSKKAEAPKYSPDFLRDYVWRIYVELNS